MSPTVKGASPTSTHSPEVQQNLSGIKLSPTKLVKLKSTGSSFRKDQMLEIPTDLAKPLPMLKQTSLIGVIRETPELIGASGR